MHVGVAFGVPLLNLGIFLFKMHHFEQFVNVLYDRIHVKVQNIYWVSSSTVLTQNVTPTLVLKWALTQHLKSQQNVCVNAKMCVKFCVNTKCNRKC